jgi:hypothetical protein
MKVIFFRAEQAHDTWPKDGFLLENGLFIGLFKWLNKPTYFATVFYPENIPAEITWGKGVFGAYHDYQTFKPTGEEKVLEGKEHLLDFLQLKIGEREFNKVGIGEGIKWAMSIDSCIEYLGLNK